MTVLAAHDSIPQAIHAWYFLVCKNCARSSSVIPGGRGSFPAGNSGATRGKEVILTKLSELEIFLRLGVNYLAMPSLRKHPSLPSFEAPNLQATYRHELYGYGWLADYCLIIRSLVSHPDRSLMA